MITVAILINGNPIIARSAVNKGDIHDGYTRYDLDDGTRVHHRRSDGAVMLAIKMLKTVRTSADDL